MKLRGTFAWVVAVILLSTTGDLYSQQEGVEPLARGPIHEAFANPVEGTPRPGPIIDREPPAPIEELPPEQKPDDESVQWIPGYWAWDDAREDFLWVSGFWRVPPPGRLWIPGNWERVEGGWRWVPGFWASAESPQLNYLPPPPESIESGPSVPAPSPEHIYVPGTWVYSTSRYVWRPGTWVIYRPGWVWIPACYRWTPVGYVFIDGYWDYPLARRGLLFAPVWVDRRVCYRPRWFFSPTIAIYDDALYGAMFVRPGCHHYFFGDYFEARFTRIGYRSWFSVSFGRGFTYDPLWSYYEVSFRRDPFWAPAIREVYLARYAGHLPRPPVTIVNQVNNITVNNVTNVNIINNPTIVNNYKNIIKSTNISNIANVNNTVVNIRNIDRSRLPSQGVDAASLEKFQKLKPIGAEQKEILVRETRQIRDLAKHRAEVENQLRASNSDAKTPAPKTVQLKVPESLGRAIPNKPKAAPPPPAVERPKLPDAPAFAGKPAAETKVPTPTIGSPAKLKTDEVNNENNKDRKMEAPKGPVRRIETPNMPRLPNAGNRSNERSNAPSVEKPNASSEAPNRPGNAPAAPKGELPKQKVPENPMKKTKVEPNVPPTDKPKLPEENINRSTKRPTTPGTEMPTLDQPIDGKGMPANPRGPNRPNIPTVERTKVPDVPPTPNRPDHSFPGPQSLTPRGVDLPKSIPTRPSASGVPSRNLGKPELINPARPDVHGQGNVGLPGTSVPPGSPTSRGTPARGPIKANTKKVPEPPKKPAQGPKDP
jgi:hypothetical protein